MSYAARPDRLAKAKGDYTHERYGAIDASVGPRSKLVAGLDHLAAGTPIGAVMGWRHQGRANKLRRELGGSPEKTPKDLKGRLWRNVGVLTGGGVGGAVGSIGGTLVGGAVGARFGGVGGALAGSLAGRTVGGVGGMGMGAIAAHRRVRDSQIYSRDFAKAAGDVMHPEGHYAIPLAKNWRAKLPAILDAVRAIQEAEAAGMGDDLQLDAEDVLRLVNRVVAHVRQQGAATVAKSADATLDVLVKAAPDLTLLAFAGMDPADQQDFLGAGDALLDELDALHKAAGGDGRDALAKRAIDMDRLMKGSGSPELVKFWGAVAATAGRVAPQIGQAAMRWAGSLKGTMGPRLSALVGNAGQAAQRMGGRVANFARGPAQGSLPLQGGGGGGMAGWGRRAAGAVQGFGRQAYADPMGTARRSASAVGQHLYQNRGGYGLTAGMEIQRRMGSGQGQG